MTVGNVGWEPSFVLLYGRSGLRKTTSMIEAFPLAAWAASPGALAPSASFLGLPYQDILARTFYVQTLEQILGLFEKVGGAGYPAFCVDDTSLLAESTEAALRATDPRNPFAPIRNLNTRTAQLRNLGRYMGVHFGMTLHEKGAGTDGQGVDHKGGPKMPTWNTGDSLVNAADFVAHVAEDPKRPGRPGPGRAVFDVGHDSHWETDDRYTVAPPRGPANLRVLLTRAGFQLPRWPGLEWQDGIAAMVSGRIQGGEERNAVVRDCFAQLRAQNIDDRHTAWAVRDGLDDAEIASLQADQFLDMLIAEPTGLTGGIQSIGVAPAPTPTPDNGEPSGPAIGTCDAPGCGLPVQNSPGGTVCPSGHGGAPYTPITTGAIGVPGVSPGQLPAPAPGIPAPPGIPAL